ncbi:MAG: DMT family transporter [Desulfosarcina sp.]|jgi:drug/metabolite transporter (DMT)-like permease
MSRFNTHQQVRLDAAIAGPLFMLAAALLFTVLSLLIKLMGPQYTIWHIGFYRFFGGVVFLVLVFGRYGNPYRGHNTRLLIIRGLTGSAAFISVITAIRLLPVSTALVIFYAFPAFSAVFSYLIYGDRISKAEVACIAMVIVGIGVLFDFKLQGDFFGQIMALTGAAFAGLTVTLIKTLREKNGPVIIYLYFCTMGSLITLPAFAMAPLLPVSAMDWTMAMGIVFASVIAQLCMNQGFFYCRGWEGGVFMSSEVVFTAIVGITFLGDPATWRFWTGGLLVFASGVTLNRFKANHAKLEKRG